MLLTKRCCRCGVVKEAGEFSRRADGPGLRHACKPCRSERQKEYVDENSLKRAQTITLHRTRRKVRRNKELVEELYA